MKRGVLLLLAFLAVTGCEKNSYSTFSNKYRVSFSYNLTVAPFNQITSQGRFVGVRQVGNILKTVDSDGHTQDHALAETEARMFIMGLGGLIIGTPTFNNDDLSIWAYDLGCPVCDNGSRLTFNTVGDASCAKCGNHWNLNSSGFPTTNDSGQVRPLYRYRVLRTDISVTVTN